MGNRDVNDVMPGSEGLRILGDFEKKSSLLRFRPGRVQLGLRNAPCVVGSDETVSIVKIRVENLKVLKVIKVSYLN